MPRQFQLNRCNECRRRRVRCDGIQPSCTPCQKSDRPCQWPSGDRTTPSTRNDKTNTETNPNPISTNNSEISLQNPKVYRLFRHYKDHLASWYDLNDQQRHFTDMVSVKARHSPLLLSAILAFSAISLHNSSSESLVDEAEFYHLESVQILLRITRSLRIEDVVSNGELLASICLLRSFEIISQNLSSQSHLQGCYSILASNPINLDSLSSLARASFWNYLREDITMALIERRRLMIDLSDEHLPKDLHSDDDYANAVTVMLGQVINECFAQNATSLGRLSVLENHLQGWNSSLPHSFTPITNHSLVEDGQSAFPFMGTLHGWHAAAIQYYETAMIILALSKPKEETNTTIDNMKHTTELTRDLEHRSSNVCALALSSESQAVWINSFGPIAFCGCWLRDQSKIKQITSCIDEWGSRTGWPVSDIIEELSHR